MDVQHIAAFAMDGTGGNPAGVVLLGALPEAAAMQAVAADLGYSETVFAAPVPGGWRVRYFAPAMEVPFCGHATIALGAALARQAGEGVHRLLLNEAEITVEGRREGGHLIATLVSPPTWHEAAPTALLEEALALFGYAPEELDPRLPPAVMGAGARHLLLALSSRERLAAMAYDLAAGAALMRDAGLVTIMLVQAESPHRFHARNAFAAGGVAEDPATGAAAAAFAGYLRALGWPHGGGIEILQGQDMGMPSLLRAEIPPGAGTGIRVSGAARISAGPLPLPG
ncbi:PhzF family phenazine biosynthesis protein [Roseomonas rosulenta]|uniref:PhzF family phenazine biosynthesis protein n=1 Tax=Roseomonas rosulenta TaxID=2748667 RepID=UPI0018DF9E33|nr:PhzF family phenazine biosynthesis isomerase [Roseomonas rosulenta]